MILPNNTLMTRLEQIAFDILRYYFFEGSDNLVLSYSLSQVYASLGYIEKATVLGLIGKFAEVREDCPTADGLIQITLKPNHLSFELRDKLELVNNGVWHSFFRSPMQLEEEKKLELLEKSAERAAEDFDNVVLHDWVTGTIEKLNHNAQLLALFEGNDFYWEAIGCNVFPNSNILKETCQLSIFDLVRMARDYILSFSDEEWKLREIKSAVYSSIDDAYDDLCDYQKNITELAGYDIAEDDSDHKWGTQRIYEALWDYDDSLETRLSDIEEKYLQQEAYRERKERQEKLENLASQGFSFTCTLPQIKEAQRFLNQDDRLNLRITLIGDDCTFSRGERKLTFKVSKNKGNGSILIVYHTLDGLAMLDTNTVTIEYKNDILLINESIKIKVVAIKNNQIIADKCADVLQEMEDRGDFYIDDLSSQEQVEIILKWLTSDEGQRWKKINDLD